MRIATLFGCVLGPLVQGPTNLSLLTPAVRRFAERNQMPIHVWEVDEPAECQRLFSLGVAAVFSNVPQLLVSALREPSEGQRWDDAKKGVNDRSLDQERPKAS